MQELKGNLWEPIFRPDATVVTTNGQVNRYEKALVMGKGLALEAAQRQRTLPKVLGERVGRFGNHVFIVKTEPPSNHFTSPILSEWIVSFPTKEHWQDPAIPSLIEQSAQELVCIARAMNWKLVAMPRVGCGLGGLKWEDVKSILEKYLDDRFYILHQD